MGAALRRGTLVAEILAGAWRRKPAAPRVQSEQIGAIVDLLYASGAATLAWFRLRNGSAHCAPGVEGLHEAYRLATLEAAIGRRDVADAFRVFRGAGIEPLLAKGWAAARHYAEDGLRPYTDIDLYVRPAQIQAARKLLGERRTRANVDLHQGVPSLDDRPLEELYARTRTLELHGVPVRVLGPEDHLRLLCLHMLGHGAWRPLWLCDLAAVLETAGPLDWSYLLSGDERRSDWLVCSLVLARDLLGADLGAAPEKVLARRLPHWLAPTLLRQWGTLLRRPQGARLPIEWQLRLAPSGIPAALVERWPNGIEATVGRRGPFNGLPRWPFQVGECLARFSRFVRQLPGILAARPLPGAP